MYDSIHEIPALRYKEYNRLIAIDAGIGSDMQSIDRHAANVKKFYDLGQKEKAEQILENLRQNIWFVITGTSPEMNAFVSLIHSINGRVINDRINEPEKVLEELSKKGLLYGHIERFLQHVKKKLRLN